jgi:hypothetical protein
MRSHKALLSTLLMFWCVVTLAQPLTQINSVKTDPRQYIKIQYRKNAKHGQFFPIWNWEGRSVLPDQKFSYLDVDGIVEIDFIIDSLVNNRYFVGNFSLEADITGADGTRKIEVSPYSEVGVNREKLGVESEPSFQLAQKLVNMFDELQGVDKINEIVNTSKIFGLRFSNVSFMDKQKLDKELALIQKDIDDKKDKNGIIGRLQTIYALISKTTGIPTSAGRISPDLTHEQISAYRNYYQSEIQNSFELERDRMIDTYEPALEWAKRRLGITLAYLNSFEGNGNDATSAFFSIINLDLVKYALVKSQLLEAQKKIFEIKLDISDRDEKAKILLENQDLIQNTIASLWTLSRFQGSQFEELLQNRILQYDPTFGSRAVSRSDTNEIYRLSSEYGKLLSNRDQQLVEALFRKATVLIYKRLVHATIDLGKSGAKPGELLNIYVTWKNPRLINDVKSEKDQKAPLEDLRLTLGKYYLRETGWKTEVSDMFALVKRINEPNTVNNNPNNVSPSNYKGSGGAVLMWTYYAQDKGLVRLRRQNGETSKKKNRFANFLEPSFGLNVSYLDFSTDKDVEIGTGLQMGIFRNKIFFGYGLNLHLLRPKGQDPTYFYLGFSFAKLSDMFKDSKRISASD